MKKIKFRHSEGFLTFEIPDDAVQLVGYDSTARKFTTATN